MRDFIFTLSAERQVTLRTDFLGSGTSGNFTVMEILGLDEQALGNNNREKELAVAFKRLPYTVEALITHAETYNLGLISRESNGTGSVQLVNDADDSESYDSW